MPKPSLPRVRPGDDILAVHINLPNEVLERQKIIGGAGILVTESAAGTLIASTGATVVWAKITGGGTGGKYAWTEQVPQDSGAWVDGFKSGTVANNFAVESNLSTTVPVGKIVALRLGKATGPWVFTYGACS